jgi:hypothetical protein
MKKAFTTLCALICLSVLSLKAQDPNVSVYIDNFEYLSSNACEFDIMVKANSPTSTFQLRTLQAGLYVNPAWVNGGILSLQNVATYTELLGPGYNGVFQWNSTDKVINCSVNFGIRGSSTCVSTTVTTTPLKVTRIRATNTLSYTCSTPDLKFNYVSNASPLRLRSSISWREVSCNINFEMFYPGRTYTGTANFNGENFSLGDADGKSIVRAAANPGFCFSELKLTAFLQGFYSGGQTMETALLNSGVEHANSEQTDSIRVELRPAANPNVTAYSVTTIIRTDGIAYCLFPTAAAGSSYYIVFKHRNALETWSASPVALTASTNYNFSIANSQAYQDVFNIYPQMIQVEPGVWSIYNGDVTQDGTIDGFDFAAMETDVNDQVFGYYVTDVSNAGPVDGFDFALLEQNVGYSLFIARP